MFGDRRNWLIGGALVMVIGAVGWSIFGPAAATPSARGPRGVAARPAGSEAPLPAAESVRLAALEQPRDEPSAVTRNPFEFGRRAVDPPPPTGEAMPTSTLKPDNPPSPPPVAGPPPLPPIPLKFIGVVETSDGTMLAVLVPRQGNTSSPMHGREGDIIDGRYRIVKIGNESIEMTYVDGRGRQTIRLTGQ